MSTIRIPILLICLCLVRVALAEPEGRLVTRGYRPMPDTATYRIWEQDYFSGPELWLVQNEVMWEDIARIPGLRQDVLVMLLLLKTMPKTVVENNELLFRAGRSNTRYARVTGELKALLPTEVIRAIYSWQIEVFGAPPSVKFKEPADVKAWLLKSGVDPKHIDRLLERNTTRANGWTHFVLTPDIGPLVTDDVKKELRPFWREIINNVHKASPGVEVFLEYGPQSDPAAIAKKYAAGRDPAPIERLLRAHLAKSPTGASIPLQDILTPHARKRFGAFAVCDGPNCHDTAYKIATGDRLDHIDERSAAEWASLMLSEFRRVPVTEAPRPGDLIVYYEGTKLVHTAYYISPDLVLTKNGRSRFAPEIFQNREATDKLYVKDHSNVIYYRYDPPMTGACAGVPAAAGG